MKISFTPYYNMPDCYSQQRPDASPAMPETTPPGTNPLAPLTPTNQPQALSLQSTEYLNGYLRTQIGRMVRIEFLIGTGTLVDRTGTLLSVGANFLTIRQVQTDDIVACDFFSIKFITFFY
jgi:hypothetical protein